MNSDFVVCSESKDGNSTATSTTGIDPVIKIEETSSDHVQAAA